MVLPTYEPRRPRGVDGWQSEDRFSSQPPQSRPGELESRELNASRRQVSERLHGPVAVHLQSRHLGSHTDVDCHVRKIIRGSEVSTPERNGLARITRHSHAYEIAISHNGIGRIKLHPSGAGQIDVAPGVGRTSAAVVLAVRAAQIK